jgi:hypothetical protein
VAHEIAARFAHATEHKGAAREPASRAGVAAARERISAELAFIGYIEAIHRAATGGAHTE